MKKNILKATLVAAIALVASVNVYNARQSDMEMSDLALANVEALANSELSDKKWNREDYTLDNGTPAVNCWEGGSSDCVLR